jgi:hypothetical protein
MSAAPMAWMQMALVGVREAVFRAGMRRRHEDTEDSKMSDLQKGWRLVCSSVRAVLFSAV